MRAIGRLWRGGIGLARTFWIYGLAVSAVLSQLAFRLNVIRPPRSAWIDIAAPAVTFISGVYLLFVAVAVWRSADRYRGPAVWPILAKLSVVAVVAVMLAHTGAQLLR
ncbi:MAG TPA: hypothetical protein VIM38_13280 [Alphaproteobacteria bacterium]